MSSWQLLFYQTTSSNCIAPIGWEMGSRALALHAAVTPPAVFQCPALMDSFAAWEVQSSAALQGGVSWQRFAADVLESLRSFRGL